VSEGNYALGAKIEHMFGFNLNSTTTNILG